MCIFYFNASFFAFVEYGTADFPSTFWQISMMEVPRRAKKIQEGQKQLMEQKVQQFPSLTGAYLKTKITNYKMHFCIHFLPKNCVFLHKILLISKHQAPLGKITNRKHKIRTPQPAHIILCIHPVSIVKIWSEALAIHVVKWISSPTSLKMSFLTAWMTGNMSIEDAQKHVTTRMVR